MFLFSKQHQKLCQLVSGCNCWYIYNFTATLQCYCPVEIVQFLSFTISFTIDKKVTSSVDISYYFTQSRGIKEVMNTTITSAMDSVPIHLFW